MKDTVGELFEISIIAEKEALSLYAELAGRFKGLPRACDFFESLASDEADHISSLEGLRDSLSPEELAAPAPQHAMSMAQGFLNLSADSLAGKIRTLEDAYKAVVNLEYSEVNKLHELIIELNVKDESSREEMKRMLSSHLKKVTAFRNSGADMDYVG